MSTKRGAFFLDRDGTINIDRVYINDARLMELIPGAARALRKLNDRGYPVVVVTNQSGVGRGIISPDALPKIHDRLDELLREQGGARIDLYQICRHSPQEQCDCRKPQPKLVHEAAKDLGIDLNQSVFIGDKLSDVATGKNAGCRYSILLRTGKGQQEEILAQLTPRPDPSEVADFVAEDLAEAVDWALTELDLLPKL